MSIDSLRIDCTYLRGDFFVLDFSGFLCSRGVRIDRKSIMLLWE